MYHVVEYKVFQSMCCHWVFSCLSFIITCLLSANWSVCTIYIYIYIHIHILHVARQHCADCIAVIVVVGLACMILPYGIPMRKGSVSLLPSCVSGVSSADVPKLFFIFWFLRYLRWTNRHSHFLIKKQRQTKNEYYL